MYQLLSSVHTSTTGRNIWWMQVTRTFHKSQVRITNTYTGRKFKIMFLKLPVTIFFFLSLQQSFTRPTPLMMKFPACLMGPSNKSMVGMQCVFFINDNMLINIRIFLYDRDYNIHVHMCVCVFQSQSTGHFCLTLRPRVRSCWALWTQWTTGSGEGNHGAGESSNY